MPASDGLPARISEALTRLLALAFALVFGAAGLAAQWWWWRGASQAFEARTWVAQPAVLTGWSLAAVGATSMVVDPRAESARALQAQFRYEVDGRVYTAAQVFVAPLVDTVSDRARDRAAGLLQAAQARDGQGLTLWRDPQQPQRAVLIRSLPAAFAAGLVAFMVFPCGPATAVLLGWLLALAARLGLPGAPRWTGRLWCAWHGTLAAASLWLAAPGADLQDPALLVLAGLLLLLWWPPLRALAGRARAA